MGFVIVVADRGAFAIVGGVMAEGGFWLVSAVARYVMAVWRPFLLVDAVEASRIGERISILAWSGSRGKGTGRISYQVFIDGLAG